MKEFSLVGENNNNKVEVSFLTNYNTLIHSLLNLHGHNRLALMWHVMCVGPKLFKYQIFLFFYFWFAKYIEMIYFS